MRMKFWELFQISAREGERAPSLLRGVRAESQISPQVPADPVELTIHVLLPKCSLR